MDCDMDDCAGHMVAVTEKLVLDSGMKAEVPVLRCVGCGVELAFGGKSDLMLKWANMYVRQADE